MMKNYLILAVLLIATTTNQALAKWEQIRSLPATYDVFVAPNGNLIMSDFTIFLSLNCPVATVAQI